MRELRFISTGEAEHEETCPDYLTLLCLPGLELDCAAAAWGAILGLDWERLELLDVPSDSPLLGSPSLPSIARCYSRGSCPVADLTGGFDAYLARLSSNSRQRARRLLRQGSKAGVSLEFAHQDSAEEALTDLMRLHQERWSAEGKSGVFAARRFVEFHRRLVRQWLGSGRAVLARMFHRREPIAVLYGFVSGERLEFYQSGVRREVPDLQSPGTLAHLLLMRQVASRGLTGYDFLRGSAPYKAHFATRQNELVAVEAWRPTARTTAYRALRAVVRRFRRALRSANQGGRQ